MKKTCIFVTMLALAVGGCDLNDEPVGPPPSNPRPPAATSLRQALHTSQTVSLDVSSTVGLTAVRHLQGDMTYQADLSVRGGTIALTATTDGTLLVDELVADVGDITIPASALPPNGLKLTKVKLRLFQEAAAETTWLSDMGPATGTGKINLVLEWSMILSDGTVVPLAPQKIFDAPLTLEVTDGDAHKPVVTLRAQHNGVFFSWSGLIELKDLSIDFQAK